MQHFEREHSRGNVAQGQIWTKGYGRRDPEDGETLRHIIQRIFSWCSKDDSVSVLVLTKEARRGGGLW